MKRRQEERTEMEGSSVKDLPSEIIKLLPLKAKLCMSAINTKLRMYIDVIYFAFPRFKKSFSTNLLTQLPIKVLQSSQLRDVSYFPQTLQTFIMDVRKPFLDPSMIW